MRFGPWSNSERERVRVQAFAGVGHHDVLVVGQLVKLVLSCHGCVACQSLAQQGTLRKHAGAAWGSTHRVGCDLPDSGQCLHEESQGSLAPGYISFQWLVI